MVEIYITNILLKRNFKNLFVKNLLVLLIKLRTYFGAPIFCIILDFTRRYYEDKIYIRLITKRKHNKLK